MDPEEKNSTLAIERGILNFDGIETDIRDVHKNLAVSHDMPEGRVIFFEKILSDCCDTEKVFAINIKADGLSDSLKRLLEVYNIKNYFTFDMSIPEMVVYRDRGLKFYTSISDICTHPILIESASGIWLDSFEFLWYSENELLKIIDFNLPICVVSEELHGRDHLSQWSLLSRIEQKSNFELSICTDYPSQARDYFNVNQRSTK